MTVLFASSCAVVGKEFPVDPVTQIKIGQTTKVEVSRWFGTPWRTGWEDGQKNMDLRILSLYPVRHEGNA